MNYQILGELQSPTGEFTTDPEGFEIPVMETIEGFHVNTTEAIEGADEYRVSPTVPRVVYAGVETFFYLFPDEDTFRTFIPVEVLDEVDTIEP